MPGLQPKPLVLDLETKPQNTSEHPSIFMIAGMRPDSGQEIELSVKRNNPLAQCLQALEMLGAGAEYLLGHNILNHDLPILKSARPNLALLRLPAIDTLFLSPLAFPRNPYHRLVKDYKLVRDSLNSPLKDCRSTWELFNDQQAAFRGMVEHHPYELLCYQALLAPSIDQGAGRFWADLTGKAPISVSEVANLLPEILKETDTTLNRDLKVCRTRLNRVMSEDVFQPEHQLALVYALAWLRVSGGNSVLPPWVFHQFPVTEKLLHELRDVTCGDPECQYCQTTHDPRRELQRYFGFPDFRHDEQGRSLQKEVVTAGMQGKHVLAILATGGGKSLCYQLPALNRYHRNGSLTVIISPLQSLMKDQVDGLLESNISCAAALNGLLTMPERADVLEKIQMGDVGILLVSPEQFRNKTFQRAIKNRRVGAWIFDEAHCLSKWGHDFRPDYLYAPRFIREFTGDGKLAAIGCFTATAKPDVLADIKHHFHEELGVEFETFIGTHERENLFFDVLPCEQSEKLRRTLDILDDSLQDTNSDSSGGAVVFVSSRKRTEEYASFIADQGWACQHYHAGLDPTEKKDIQDAFKSGQLRIIVATNAFGMGVDKSDIRLVVHADIPGSLENYLQEAGRAGRDQMSARCVLLYCPDDIETQFKLTQSSRLSFRDIQQIFRKLRSESQHRQHQPLVITPGEILRDETVMTEFSHDDRDAETKVSTAVSWLEKGKYLERNENVTKIFASGLRKTDQQIAKLLDEAKLPRRKRAEYESIIRFLRTSEADERVSTDDLASLTGQTADEVIASLHRLEELGILKNDTRITAFLRHGIENPSQKRLDQILALETALFEVLSEQAPDAENGQWQDINLSALTSKLRTTTGISELLPQGVLTLLKSLSKDRSVSSEHRSSFELKTVNQETLKLKLLDNRSWKQLSDFGEKRRDLANNLLKFLLAKLPEGVRGKNLMVDTTFGEMEDSIANDLLLASRIKHGERHRAVEHVLLYLHSTQVLLLNHGMALMRRAMTISVNEDKSRYLKNDFTRLEEHYQERLIQVHVMREYATRALEEMSEALKLVLHYFSHEKDQFLKEYFTGRQKSLQRATSDESWQAIVADLSRQQHPVVVDDKDRNRLVLAGPGSGKTRVIVHRVAYLLRVRRIPPQAILILSFNRHAANEIRKRLLSLIGKDAYGVTVLTYHRLAMRLTGVKFERNETVDSAKLESIMQRAVDLLGGSQQIADSDSEEDSLRDQLLRGYRFVLVDEYQDIDHVQYELISGLTGRQSSEEDQLCILAVGDDDQNIYTFRNTSNEYIHRFKADYKAEIHFLVENYRSTEHIITVANRLIAQNADRLKLEHPISVDKHRRNTPLGGSWSDCANANQGKVTRLEIPVNDCRNGNLQAQAVMAWFKRLRSEGAESWSDFAVLARTHHYLVPLRAYCEQKRIPYWLSADKETSAPITRTRPFVQLVDRLKSETAQLGADRLDVLIEALETNKVWASLMSNMLADFVGEFGTAEVSGHTIIDWMYDYFREIRQQPKPGLFLGTSHSAKGLEFKHVAVLDGGWKGASTAQSEERRLYYVSMTRAEETLALCEFAQGNALLTGVRDATVTAACNGAHLPQLDNQYRELSLKDIDIGFAGRKPATDPIHGWLKQLRPGDPLIVEPGKERYLIRDQHGNIVGRTIKNFQIKQQIESVTVGNVVTRYSIDSAEEYQSINRVERWEVVLPSITTSPAVSNQQNSHPETSKPR